MSEIRMVDKAYDTKRKKVRSDAKLVRLGDSVSSVGERLSTGFEEFDRVLGGGIVSGSVVLLSGDPGIGKSTLLLELGLYIAGRKGKSVVYISSEESEEQLRMRADRLVKNVSLSDLNLFALSTSDIDHAVHLIEKEKPSLVIVDSIQMMETQEIASFPGSVAQIRYATSSLVELAKGLGIPLFLVGHVTKEGIVAGPMLLSHMVDAVLYLEGESFSGTRMLRAFKNRFGDCSEVGIFTMAEKGMNEIKDASSFFLNKKNASVPGNCVAVVMEGSRPILVEIQALVVPSSLSYPRRVVSGLPERRVELLLAAVQKHIHVALDRTDVFLNVVGGLKILETASDLAICLSLISSFRNKPLFSLVAISEVGLLGELRAVVNLEKRISEARKFGYTHVLTSKIYPFLDGAVKSILGI